MHTFKDNRSRPWTIAINIAAVKRVKARLGVDLYASVSEGLKSLGKLLSDVITLVDVIYVLCETKASELEVSDEDFGAALGGDAIEHATEAFLKALVDFFPEARTRATLTTVLAKSKVVRDRLLDQAVSQAEALDPESLFSHLMSSSTSSPASSVSIPAP